MTTVDSASEAEQPRAGLLRDLLLGSKVARGTVRSVVYSIALVGAIVLPDRGWMTVQIPHATLRVPDVQAWYSLDQAINLVFCGTTAVSHSYRIADYVSTNPSALEVPVRELIVGLAGSREAYCGEPDITFLNSENSLMLATRAVLVVNRNASVASIERALGLGVAVILAVFTFVLVRAGTGLARVALSLASILLIFRDLVAFRYSVYFFILPIVLLNVTFYSLAILLSFSSTVRRHAVTLLAAGLLASFSANMRTSYLPMLVLFATVYCATMFVSQRRSATGRAKASPAAWSTISVAAFIAGYLVFHLLFIRPLVPKGASYNTAHHPIAHPLVLSLAVLPNDLSDREGIRWEDEVGFTLAQRMIPEATYLGPLYEKALFAYYRKLWRQYPQQMLGIYTAKLAYAAPSMFDHARRFPRGGSLYGAVLLPLAGFSTGLFLLVAYAATAAIATWRSIRTGSLMSFVTALLGIAALMAYLESALIMPIFYLQYSGTLLFSTIFLALAAYEWVIDLAVTFLSGRSASSLRLPIGLASAVSFLWYAVTRVAGRLSNTGVAWRDAGAVVTAVVYGTLCAVVYGVFRLVVGRTLSAVAAVLVVAWTARLAPVVPLPDLVAGVLLVGGMLFLMATVDREHADRFPMRLAVALGAMVGLQARIGTGPTLAGWLAPPVAWTLVRTGRPLAPEIRTAGVTAFCAVALVAAWLTSPRHEASLSQEAHAPVTRFEQAASSQSPHIFKAPPETLVDDEALKSPLTPVDARSVVLKEPVVREADGTLTVEGAPKTRYAFVFQTAKQPMKRGDRLVAQGRVDHGGVTIGFLTDDGDWGPYANILERGEFLSVVQIAKDGEYSVVIANCAPGSQTDVSASLNRFGFLVSR